MAGTFINEKWTGHHQYVEERDDEGDIIPDGDFSVGVIFAMRVFVARAMLLCESNPQL